MNSTLTALFRFFCFVFLNVGDWDFYVKRRGKLGLGLCFNTRILTVHAEMTWIADYLRNSQRPLFSCSREYGTGSRLFWGCSC